MYLENVMMDASIADGNVWETLKQKTADIYAARDVIKRIKIRKARAQEFFSYMKKLYDTLHNESVRRGFAGMVHPSASGNRARFRCKSSSRYVFTTQLRSQSC